MQIMSLSIFSYHSKSKIKHHFMPGIELNARQKINENVDLPKLEYSSFQVKDSIRGMQRRYFRMVILPFLSSL